MLWYSSWTQQNLCWGVISFLYLILLQLITQHLLRPSSNSSNSTIISGSISNRRVFQFDSIGMGILIILMNWRSDHKVTSLLWSNFRINVIRQRDMKHFGKLRKCFLLRFWCILTRPKLSPKSSSEPRRRQSCRLKAQQGKGWWHSCRILLICTVGNCCRPPQLKRVWKLEH